MTIHDDAWATRGEAVIAVRCRECGHQFGEIHDSAVGPFLKAIKEPKRRSDKAARAEAKDQGRPYVAAREVIVVVLSEPLDRSMRCRCGRPEFTIDYPSLQSAWDRRSRRVRI